MGFLVSAAVTDTGELYCWGEGSKGQQGTGDTQDALVPHKLLSDIKTVSAGYDHMAAAANDGLTPLSFLTARFIAGAATIAVSSATAPRFSATFQKR